MSDSPVERPGPAGSAGPAGAAGPDGPDGPDRPAGPTGPDSPTSPASPPSPAANTIPVAAGSSAKPRLRRSREHKMISGVCGGLGRYYDLDPVIFRVVLAVLAVSGGLGLIAYGFAWLLIPLDGEDENEGRRLLSGRVEGAALTAVLCALVGCGLFLTMLNNGSVLAFSLMLSVAAIGSAYWSQHRRRVASEGAFDKATAQAVADAPPETLAPPSPSGPSWWRDPIVKDGTTGLPGTGYLWGPADAADGAYGAPYGPSAAPGRSQPVRRRTSIAGRVFLIALLGCVVGVSASMDTQPVGTSLQIGLSCALIVFGLGIVLSAWYGRTGGGTIVLAVITGLLLAGAAALPKSITHDWARRTWTPTTSMQAQLQTYELGSGVGVLDLTGLKLKSGEVVSPQARIGAGRLQVTVPDDVTVELTAKVGLGDIRVPGERENDIDVGPGQHETLTLRPSGGGAPHGTMRLDLVVGLGQVEVIRATS
ncbi:PspC domain-containing protein [Streptomyces sp. H27-D2]|uniref:PspC domain-containing protein n=1 Tax=Streptomyces sp. H27-D2 TaxID=3046304 RepID=UPI002DBCEB41|nr:PspC domain-containing protein [Streptomyces sp. H27-D2]MEC4017471.1 PspC domain-containing protein [Streptomyces sp. H27-D2]